MEAARVGDSFMSAYVFALAMLSMLAFACVIGARPYVKELQTLRQDVTALRQQNTNLRHQVSVHANSAASCMMSRTRERAQYAHRTSGKAMLTTLTNASVPPSRQRLSHQRITEKKKKDHEKAAQKRAHASVPGVA